MVSWEPRGAGEETTAYLGRVLEEYLGFPAMARRARAGAFVARRVDVGGYSIVVGDGIGRLANELVGKTTIVHKTERVRIAAVLYAVGAGAFDGTPAEHQAWAESEDGQATIRDVLVARLGAQ